MIIKSFLTGRHEFIIGKKLTKNDKVDLINNYRKIIEKSIILSILITLVLFQLFPRHKQNQARKDRFSFSLEVVDIPITKNEEPPPAPPPVIKEVITNYEVVIKKEQVDRRKIRDEIEDVNLELDLENNNNLLASSQISDITYTDFNRQLDRYRKGVSLNISTDLNRINNFSGNNLELDLGDNKVSKKFINNSVELETPPLASVPEVNKTENLTKEVDRGLIKISENQFLLKESESTIGTAEYRLWNKINAVLDRLDKNRFGTLPKNVQRSVKGLAVTFKYVNGDQHDIFWSKGGKVIIRVTGNRPKHLSDELERAYDSLIGLTL